MKKLLFLLLFGLNLSAQNKLTLTNFKNYPFPTELTAAANGSKIAWALDEQGRRNVYVAEGPDFIARKLTDFTQDDGQEITSLQISDDGSRVVFERGGEHSGNWDEELPVNPNSELQPFKVKIASIPFAGGSVQYISEGDQPVLSPDNHSLAFIKSGQVWMAQLDSVNDAKNLFTTRGTVGSLDWSPDGSALLFVSDRGDHSIIGVYSVAQKSLKWIAPSFNQDDSPQWSPDGNKIVFVRMSGSGGAPDSMLVRRPKPWSIYIADLATGTASLLWQSTSTLRGSIPTTHGGFNLHWAAHDRIVFLSYQDGWPHLYSMNAQGGSPLLLTPGHFMCEHIALSADKKYLTFSTNSGPDKLDLERRHAAIVSVDKADMRVLTPGSGIEWAPVVLRGQIVACLSATAQRPPVPALVPVSGSNTLKLIGTDLITDDYPSGQLVTPQQVIFKSLDGVEVHADLFMPSGGPAKKAGIVYVHGGPPRQMLLGWNYSDYYSNAYASNQYLASLGYVVLSVNYRLGIGYGYEFHQPAKGGINGAAEYQDIKAAGLWLQKQSYINSGKIGIYGGSYGGYLTAMALARDSKIFAAGVDIHGVHDWGASRNIMNAYSNKTEKAPDYEKAKQVAWLSSPISSMKTWTSPVLIIHADDDRNVRFNQSTDLIQRLEKQGVPYETMMIVDDTHHWLKWENSVKVYGAVADFFERKLK